MATIHSILTNFTAGEISPRVYGRVDLAKYQNGARELTNVTVLPQGGARKRGGTLNVSNVKDNSPDAILVPFVFSTTQAYMIEFGPYYIRFFKDRGIIYSLQYAHQRHHARLNHRAHRSRPHVRAPTTASSSPT